MMDMEESLAQKANRNLDIYWGFLTLDASKCFDRIRRSETLDLALQGGGYSPDSASPCWVSQMHRVFAAGGLLAKEEVFPKNGLLQGDPLSVLLCNICVSTWAYELVKGQTQVQAYIDDRSIIARTPSDLEQAWNDSRRWDEARRWATNEKKTFLMEITSNPMKNQAVLPATQGNIQKKSQVFAF